MYQLELALHELEQARQQNEREALSVGLNYFDREQRGAISPADCPELSARLFALLDVNRDGLISHDDLQQAIERLTAELEARMDRIKQLEREVDELQQGRVAGHRAAETVAVQIAQDEATLEELRREAEERKQLLRQIFAYFHTTFALHVFGVAPRRVAEEEERLVAGLRPRRVDVQRLLAELERLEREANRDPLQVEEDDAAKTARREQGHRPAAQLTAQHALPASPSHRRSVRCVRAVSSCSVSRSGGAGDGVSGRRASSSSSVRRLQLPPSRSALLRRASVALSRRRTAWRRRSSEPQASRELFPEKERQRRED